MLGAEVDWSGDDYNFVALGLGVPPLPLWAHGEPAAMPALLFFVVCTCVSPVQPRRATFPHRTCGALGHTSGASRYVA